MTSILLQPFRLHDLTLPNRIALAPMTAVGRELLACQTN